MNKVIVTTEEALLKQAQAAMERLEELQSHVDLLRLDYDVRRQAIMAPVATELDAFENECAPLVSEAENELAAARAEAVRLVLAAGETVTGRMFQAVVVKGRVTWDTAKLEGLALAHPEIMKLKRVGEPTVTIRPITRKK